MVLGSASDVGKSLLVAGLCRVFARRGVRVAPFKAWNMSNNAAVTPDGGEIGRAQALQARAAGLTPSVHFNPILLKPESHRKSRIVVHGRVLSDRDVTAWSADRGKRLAPVLDSYRRVRDQCELVLIEGAGGAAEVNLRADDIANMGFAEAADVPAVLVVDAERGGAIAAAVGTHALLPEEERRRIGGVVVNKFHGDTSFFAGAVRAIVNHTGWPVLGVVPWCDAAGRLPAEDAVAATAARLGRSSLDPRVRVAVLRLSCIANFDDLDPLRCEPRVSLDLVEPGHPLPVCDLVLIPGTKSTLAEAAFIRAQGWDVDLAAHVRRGGHVVGVCGGYQLLGERLDDPLGVDGPPATARGLGLLRVDTVLTADKTVRRISGVCLDPASPVTGYEIHSGHTTGPDTSQPWLMLDGRPDGARASRVSGTYLHGLFTDDTFRRAFLDRLAAGAGSEMSYRHEVDAALDALADHLEEHLDIDELRSLAR
jgi:adenosylcobyric acid synthase